MMFCSPGMSKADLEAIAVAYFGQDAVQEWKQELKKAAAEAKEKGRACPGAGYSWCAAATAATPGARKPLVDVVELKDHFEVTVELPGVLKEGIQLDFDLESHQLKLSADKVKPHGNNNPAINKSEEPKSHHDEKASDEKPPDQDASDPKYIYRSRHFGAYKATIDIPSHDVDNSRDFDASFTNGVLKIQIFKTSPPKQKSKSIHIQ